MTRIFFTADTHFGHSNIIKYCDRPFLTDDERAFLKRRGNIPREAVQRMDAALLNNINALVGPDDVLWHLGDFAFGSGNRSTEVCRRYRDRIACRTINIIWGNHDKRDIRDLFSEAHDQVSISVEGQRIVLNHYAMAVWQANHRGAWHLYGHSHSNAEEWLDRHMPGRRSFDVGVDNAARVLGEYRPWTFAEIEAEMTRRAGFAMDHHGRNRDAAIVEEAD